MGAFALPSLPTLPSLPSVKSFINTSPPLVYQSQLPRDSPNTTPTRHPRRRVTDDGRLQQQHQPRALLPASPSRTDVSKEWDQVDRRRRGSITSLKSNTSYSGGLNDLSSSVGSLNLAGAPYSSNASPVRPSHRRTQSAAPRRPNPSPMGRLHEISRNPLASSSAVSLPTLCELDGADMVQPGKAFPTGTSYGASAPVSPVVAGRTRRVSRPTPIERIDSGDMDDGSECLSSPPSPSPLSLPKPLPMVADHSQQTIRARSRSAHHRSTSSVPPPNSMPPPNSTTPCRPPAARAHALMRPPPSPRSLSAEDTRPLPAVPAALGRRSSLSSNLRIGSTSVSDIAVLATWSFPADTSRFDARNGASDVPMGAKARTDETHRPSMGLRQRLQSLSGIRPDLPRSTSTASLASLSNNSPETFKAPSGPSLKRATSNASRTPGHNRPHLGHRHTHSSPNMLPLLPVSISGPINNTTYSHSVGGSGPLLPPPRPQRRPTTSRLRNPNPLCMPIQQPSARDRDAGINALGSSPASLFSDSRSTSAGSDVELVPSPSGSIVSLPPLVPLPTDVRGVGAKEKEKEAGFMGRWIRGSRGSEVDLTQGTVIREEMVRVQAGPNGKLRPGHEGDEAEDEEYLTLDDI